MYFPFLRGRQNELLAIRELCTQHLICENIIPIIEPVKFTSTLTKTIECFIKNNRKIVFICNPQVGDYLLDYAHETDQNKKNSYFEFIKHKNIEIGHILNSKSIQEIESLEVLPKELTLIYSNRDDFETYLSIHNGVSRNFLVPDSSIKRRVQGNKILYGDKFNKMDKNSEYSTNTDEFFSDDHLYYEEEGFNGFSDYSIIGKTFSESGFAPHAVAIHIVYFDDKMNLRVKHFVSDTNEDISDTAKKFYQALTKLVKWQNTTGIRTYALDAFIKHYHEKTYPGLGSVKKLSLMHHLELVSNYLVEKVK